VEAPVGVCADGGREGLEASLLRGAACVAECQDDDVGPLEASGVP